MSEKKKNSKRKKVNKLRLYKTLDKVMSGNKKKKFSRGGGVAMRGLGNATYSKKDI
mgnify:CR=1 FL=1